MTWEELCEKAKEMGGYCIEYINFEIDSKNLWFSKDGRFVVSCRSDSMRCNVTIKRNLSYEQMYQIMKALQ